MRLMIIRNTRPSSTGGACSKSGSALGLFTCGDTENVKSWMIHVFEGGRTTASGANRKLGVWCATLRGKMNARPNRTWYVVNLFHESSFDVWGYTTVIIRVRR